MTFQIIRPHILSFFSAIVLLTVFFASMVQWENWHIFTYSAGYLSLCGLICLLFWRAGCRERIDIRFGSVTVASILFWGVLCLSAILSNIQDFSFVYFYSFSLLPLSAFVFLLQPDKTAFLKCATWIFGSGFAALFISSFVQFFFLQDTLNNGFVKWPLANQNSLGALYSLAGFCGIAVLSVTKSRIISFISAFFTIGMIAGIMMTGGRGVLLSFVLFSLVFFSICFYLKRARFSKKSFFKLGVALFIFFGLFAILQFFSSSAHMGIWDIWSRSISGNRSLLWSRPDIWMSTWAIIKDHMWLGTGIGTFSLYYPAYRGNDLVSSGFMAHNDPLQFWAEAGIAAFVLFYTIIIFSTLRLYSFLKDDFFDRTIKIKISAVFSAIGAMILHSHVSYNLNILPTLLLSGMLFGVFLYYTQKKDSSDTLINAKHRFLSCRFFYFPGREFAFYGCTFILIFAAFFVRYQIPYYFTVLAGEQIKNDNFKDFSKFINIAGRLSQNNNDHALIGAASIPISIIEAQGAMLDKADLYEHFEHADRLLKQVLDVNPRSVPALYKLANLRVVSAPYMPIDTLPQSFLERALSLDPLHVNSRMLLYKVYEKQGFQNKAYDTLKDGMRWNYHIYNAVEYYERVAELSFIDGDLVLHNKALKQMYRLKEAFGSYAAQENLIHK